MTRTALTRRDALLGLGACLIPAATARPQANGTIPVTGADNRHLRPFDDLMVDFLRTRQVPGAALAHIVMTARVHGFDHVVSEGAVPLVIALREVAAMHPADPAAHVALAGLFGGFGAGFFFSFLFSFLFCFFAGGLFRLATGFLGSRAGLGCGAFTRFCFGFLGVAEQRAKIFAHVPIAFRRKLAIDEFFE